MEKTEVIMKQEMEIVLTKPKVFLVIFFMLILMVIRQVDSNCDIGIVLDSNMALLSIVCGANIIYSELYGDLRDIFKKYGEKKLLRMLYRRILIQWAFLVLVASIVYWLFFILHPEITNNVLIEYLKAEFAVAVSCLFFLALVVLFTSIFKNQWIGPGAVFLIWAFLTSTYGQHIPPEVNVLSYCYEMETLRTKQWITGKLIAMITTFLIFLAIKWLMKISRENVVFNRNVEQERNI